MLPSCCPCDTRFGTLHSWFNPNSAQALSGDNPGFKQVETFDAYLEERLHHHGEVGQLEVPLHPAFGSSH